MSLETWVRFLCVVNCRLSALLRGTEPASAVTLALLDCCALYNPFLLEFVSGNLALTGF